MKTYTDYKSIFDSFKQMLLMIAQERSVDRLLEMIVSGLSNTPHIALARIWLVLPGDLCHQCFLKDECLDQSNCLHLVASCGRSINAQSDWSQLQGRFQRFPMGIRKVGKIASRGEAIIEREIAPDSQWLVNPIWAKREGIKGFAGQPLIFRDQVLGVLIVFTRTNPIDEELDWIRMLADHAAAAIVNARAFDEIEVLRNKLELENDYLKQEVDEAKSFGGFVGNSPAMQVIQNQIEMVAQTDSNVLILGESGTGKELVAHELHNQSQRKNKPFIKVNCASIPKDLYESEFFGHIKGSFTGAVKDRQGRFQAADGGTLFLDEVGEIPLELQSKLLRVLQEGQYERVGEEKTRSVNVRIVAATNRDLKHEVELKRFRQDLYYRLNVFPIHVAPLRERKEDVPLLARHFLGLTAKRTNRKCSDFTPAQFMQLQEYHWPGNIRELQNIIERAVIICGSGPLQIELPAQSDKPLSPVTDDQPNSTNGVLTENELKQLERENIIRALKKSNGKIYGEGGAASLLGLKPTTLVSKIKKFKITKPA